MAEWPLQQLQAIAASVADEFGLDRDLFASVIQAESAWDWQAVSPAGALGLTQMTQIAAEDIGVDLTMEPVENLRSGAAYLSKMLRRFNGDTKLALAAYNAGPTLVARTKGIPNIKETKDYVAKVMKGWGQEESKIEQEPDFDLRSDQRMSIQGKPWTESELEKMFPTDRSEPTPAAPDQSLFILGGQR